MFDAYVSLGDNCEVSFQFRRVLGKDTPSFFNWNVTSTKSLVSLLNARFQGILEIDNLENHPEKHLMHDSSHDFMVHSPFSTKAFRSEPNFSSKFDDLRSKTRHLVERFVANGIGGKKTAYFYKTEESEKVRENSVEIRDALKKYHVNSDFVLIVLQHARVQEQQWEEKQIFNRYLRRFAPWEDATDGHVSSWDKIFQEFQHREGLKLAGY